MELTELTVQEGVALLVMRHDPENRFNLPFVREMRDRLQAAAADPAVKALVITSGLEKYFSNGLDLGWMGQQNQTGNREFLFCMNDLLRETVIFPKPLIAAINGHAFALGAIWACAFDFRVMREDRGWFCFPEVDVGIPFLPGMTAIVERVLGSGKWNDLVLSGRRLTGPESLQAGLVHEVAAKAQVVPRALALAGELGKKPQATYAALKTTSRRRIVHILENEDPGYISGMAGLIK